MPIHSSNNGSFSKTGKTHNDSTPKKRRRPSRTIIDHKPDYILSSGRPRRHQHFLWFSTKRFNSIMDKIDQMVQKIDYKGYVPEKHECRILGVKTYYTELKNGVRKSKALKKSLSKVNKHQSQHDPNSKGFKATGTIQYWVTQFEKTWLDAHDDSTESGQSLISIDNQEVVSYIRQLERQYEPMTIEHTLLFALRSYYHYISTETKEKAISLCTENFADKFRYFDSPIDFKSVVLNFESQVLQSFLDQNATQFESLMALLTTKNAQNSTGTPQNTTEKDTETVENISTDIFEISNETREGTTAAGIDPSDNITGIADTFHKDCDDAYSSTSPTTGKESIANQQKVKVTEAMKLESQKNELLLLVEYLDKATHSPVINTPYLKMKASTCLVYFTCQIGNLESKKAISISNKSFVHNLRVYGIPYKLVKEISPDKNMINIWFSEFDLSQASTIPLKAEEITSIKQFALDSLKDLENINLPVTNKLQLAIYHSLHCFYNNILENSSVAQSLIHALLVFLEVLEENNLEINTIPNFQTIKRWIRRFYKKKQVLPFVSDCDIMVC